MIVSGIGYDSHRYKEGRRFILGGVEIPSDFGLDGHSDADALCHAIIDALLGAAGKKDIGCLFPDTDNTWKDADSIKLLEKIKTVITDVDVVYIDSVVIAQQPKISPYIAAMKKNISEALSIDVERVNIKGKTNENLGFIGRKEGLAVISNVTVERTFNGIK